MDNLLCYLRILIVKTAINQTFNLITVTHDQYFILMASSKSQNVYYDFLSSHILVFLVNSRGLLFFDSYILYIGSSYRLTYEAILPSSFTTFYSTP